MGWKSCGNCIRRKWYGSCPYYNLCTDRSEIIHMRAWKKIPCPFCGGILSEVREYKGKQYRHCFGCHFEFDILTL